MKSVALFSMCLVTACSSELPHGRPSASLGSGGSEAAKPGTGAGGVLSATGGGGTGGSPANQGGSGSGGRQLGSGGADPGSIMSLTCGASNAGGLAGTGSVGGGLIVAVGNPGV